MLSCRLFLYLTKLSFLFTWFSRTGFFIFLWGIFKILFVFKEKLANLILILCSDWMKLG